MLGFQCHVIRQIFLIYSCTLLERGGQCIALNKIYMPKRGYVFGCNVFMFLGYNIFENTMSC